MRLLHTLALLLLLPLCTFANYTTTYDRQHFIETYATLATVEMQRVGIPASITLAQAILESSWGQGKIAVEGNNFFGIKCYNGWAGQCVQAMDDEVDPSNFRFYENVEASFRDHSEFLRTNIRYQALFSLPITDYRSWAYGLKQSGYATDSGYAEKLIRLIEEHALFLYDYATPAGQFNVLNTGFEQFQTETAQSVDDIPFYQPSDFNILNTEPAAKEPSEPVLSAPGYHLGNLHLPSKVQTMPDNHQEGITSEELQKIKPLLPLPENTIERR